MAEELELEMPTAEAVEKLRALPVHDAYQRVYFDLLASRLEKSGEHGVVPAGVLMCCVLLEADLARGVDGFTGAAMDQKLCGLPKVMFAMLTRMAIVRVQEYFPEPFAQAVKDVWAQATAKAEEGATP